MANPLSSPEFARLLDKRLSMAYEQEASKPELKGMREVFFNMASSDSAFEEFFYTTGVGDIPEFNGQLTYLSVYPGFHTKIEHKEYAGGLQAERKLLDDKKYGVLDNRAAMLARAMARTQEKSAARLFTQATSTAYDFMTSEENKPLCSSSHLTKVGGVSTATGFDNTSTLSLTKSALTTVWLKARLFKLDTGERYEGWDNCAVVVPDALADTASEIVGSQKDPDSANNTVNMMYRRFKVIPYMRLDDTDTNDWYLVDLDGLKSDFVWHDRIKAEYKNTIDWDTYAVLQAVYGRWSYGFKGWRSIIKSTAS